MFYKNVLVITDNTYLLSKFKDIISEKQYVEAEFKFACSESSTELLHAVSPGIEVKPINIKNSVDTILADNDLVISIHCKQFFPERLVRNIKCINVHPGLNPYNRGWYPQIFSIINKLPHGATIHEIDEELDHGAIINQQEVPIHVWDTSLTVYNRVLEAELILIDKNIDRILSNTYRAKMPADEGNLNLIKDYKALCEIDLEQTGKFVDFYDQLRALSHGEYKNAYFFDADGNKIYMKLVVEVEK